MTLARQIAVWETPSAGVGKPWWRRLPACEPWRTPPACGQAGLRPAVAPLGFTLVELLVVVAIILLLMSLLGAAVSNVRTAQKRNATATTIRKIDDALMEIFARYGDEDVPLSSGGASLIPNGMTADQYRSWRIRRDYITRDLPDRWTDVQYAATNLTPRTTAQRVYLRTWENLVAAGTATSVVTNNASAECLFMILLQSGLTSRTGFESLKDIRTGDQDGDGMPEFIDDWGNPVGFLLWAPALELPAGSGQRFFSPDDPFPANANAAKSPSPALGMRPLIYSPGPDGKSGFERNQEAITLSMGGSGPSLGRDCGNPKVTPPGNAGGLAVADAADYRRDNITNFDPEVKR